MLLFTLQDYLAPMACLDTRMPETLFERWNTTPDELTRIVDENPSLRGMLIGYLAELKLEQLWLSRGRISRI